MTGDKANIEEIYTKLGELYIEMDKRDEGIRYFEKALNMSTNRKDRKAEYSALIHLTEAYTTSLGTREAIAYLLKRLNAAEKMHNTESQALVLGRLGYAYELDGNTKKAEECFKEQLKLSLEIDFEFSAGKAYFSLARTLSCSLKDKYLKTMQYFEKAIETTAKINDEKGEAEAHLQLGDVYFALKNYSETIRCYEKALTFARYRHIEMKSKLFLGMLYYAMSISTSHPTDEIDTEFNYIEKSEMYLREAIKATDLLLNKAHQHDGLKVSLFNELMPGYNILTEIIMQRQEAQEALVICERGRGRSLTHLLISKYFISRQDAVALESLMLTEYDDIQAFLERSKLCILFYSLGYRLITWVLVHNQPVYHVHTLEPAEYVDLQRIGMRPAFKADESMLVRFLFETYVESLIHEAYDKMKVRDMRMSCEDRSLDDHKSRGDSDEGQAAGTSCSEQDDGAPSNQTKQLQPSLIKKQKETEESAESTDVQDNRHPLQKLFDVLVAPVLSSISDEIVIIPQGPLYLVPFAALRYSKGRRFLSETHRIRLAPSITALKTWQECPADYHSAESALVIGNPKVGKVMLRGEECTFKPLPKAQDEAEYIAGRLGVTALTGSQATKEEVKKRLAKSVAVIHIAAHGDSQRGEIALAPSESAIQKGIPEEKDYLLTMREVQKIGIRAKLVVLSCCHSGRGDINPEGLVGMSRAFLAAGARAVIASLWAVNDEVNYLFMRTLYIFLGKGHSASSSLQQTMKFMRGQLGYPDPKDWASFYLIGDDVIIDDSQWR